MPNSKDRERSRHSHPYLVEVTLSGDDLDQYGYLVDIDRVAAILDAIIEGMRDKTLNDLPDFFGLIPSIEHLARVIWTRFAAQLNEGNVTRLQVKVWENKEAWASYEAGIESQA
jgi:6-pyruvoyltetrahydropterin/6-carboxytetrahydropterin synthase